MNHCIGMAMGSVVVSLATASSIVSEGRHRPQATDFAISGCVSFLYSVWSLRHIYSEFVQGRCRVFPGTPSTSSTTQDATTLLQGKVILITGSNSGIGKETAKLLFHYGASTVILACRNAERAEEAIREILLSSPPTSSNTTTPTSEEEFTRRSSHSSRLRFLPLDLSDLQSVKDAVQTFLQWKLPLHVLINNAGVFMESYQTSPQGYEMTMASNHLGHFLLTYLLLPTLLEPKEEPARVINVTSSTYRLASRMEVDDLLCTKHRKYTFFGQYAQTKLANILFTTELARRYPNTLRTYAVHPGLVRTNGR